MTKPQPEFTLKTRKTVFLQETTKNQKIVKKKTFFVSRTHCAKKSKVGEDSLKRTLWRQKFEKIAQGRKKFKGILVSFGSVSHNKNGINERGPFALI